MMMMSLGFTVAKVNYLFGYKLLILMYSSVVNFCASIFDLHLLYISCQVMGSIRGE